VTENDEVRAADVKQLERTSAQLETQILKAAHLESITSGITFYPLMPL